jgi:MFS transporter, DHA1 family, tetracycline resistance protein
MTTPDPPDAAAAPASIRDGPLLAVTGAAAINLNVVIPVLPFLAGKLGAGPFLVGLLFTVFGLAQLLTAPVWGALADRYSAKHLIMLALLIGAAGNLLFALSSSYPLLLAGRAVAGLGAASTLLAEAHVAATGSRDRRAARFGKIGAVQGVGTVLGPVLGAVLVRHGDAAVGLGAFCICLLALGYTAIALPDDRGRANAAPQPVADQRQPGLLGRLTALGVVIRVPELRRLAVLTGVAWGCFAGFAAVLPLYLEHHLGMTAARYGYLLAVSGIVAITIRGLLFGRLARRVGEHRMLVAGASCLAMSMLATLAIPSVWWAPLLPVLYALGASLFFPCLMAKTAAAAPSSAAGSVVGSVIGGISMASSLGIFAGPLLLGALSELAGQAVPFLAGGLMMLTVAAITSRWSRPGGQTGSVATPGAASQAPRPRARTT